MNREKSSDCVEKCHPNAVALGEGVNDVETELTNRDHQNITAFSGHILDGYRSGAISKAAATGALAHGMKALARGDLDDARRWYEEGRTVVQETMC